MFVDMKISGFAAGLQEYNKKSEEFFSIKSISPGMRGLL